MAECNDLVERLTQRMHEEGLARTEKARRTFRDSFPSDEAYRAHMRTIALKSRAVRMKAAVIRRRNRALERLREGGAA